MKLNEAYESSAKCCEPHIFCLSLVNPRLADKSHFLSPTPTSLICVQRAPVSVTPVSMTPVSMPPGSNDDVRRCKWRHSVRRIGSLPAYYASVPQGYRACPLFHCVMPVYIGTSGVQRERSTADVRNSDVGVKSPGVGRQRQRGFD